MSLPNSLEQIGAYAFSDCTALLQILIPDSVTLLELGAFRNCRALCHARISNSLAHIGESAFACCSLTSVAIPSSVTRIGLHAFAGCSQLREVEISSSVTQIGAYAFSDCGALEEVPRSRFGHLFRSILDEDDESICLFFFHVFSCVFLYFFLNVFPFKRRGVTRVPGGDSLGRHRHRELGLPKLPHP